jgi:opacity protein-like surface antigen
LHACAPDESKYSNPAWRQDRNFSFTTPVKEFAAMFVWNIKGNNYDRQGWMPYVLAGAGISFVRPSTDFSKINVNVFKAGSDVQLGIAADMAHGPAKKLLAMPVGLGVEKSISDRFSLQLESAYRFIFNDYLDGVSQSANPSIKDHYHSTTLQLVYKFGKKITE